MNVPEFTLRCMSESRLASLEDILENIISKRILAKCEEDYSETQKKINFQMKRGEDEGEGQATPNNLWFLDVSLYTEKGEQGEMAILTKRSYKLNKYSFYNCLKLSKVYLS